MKNIPKKSRRVPFRQALRQYRRSPLSLALFLLVRLAAVLTAGVFVAIVGYILVKGIPFLSLDMFTPSYNTTNLSLFPAMVNTLVMALLALLIAAPLGIFAAIYLVEYAGASRAGPAKGGKRRPLRPSKGARVVVGLIRAAAETLAGVPSIVYGLFGMLLFVVTLGWGLSILAGAFTLAIMILPLILRTTEEALKAVPDLYREGSFGLGAGKLRTIFRIVLPAAVPGILAGVILAVGRVVSETAALIYTAGNVAQIPQTPMGSGRTLALHMYALSNEGLYIDKAYATAVVLLGMVLLINTFSGFVAKKISKGTVPADG